MANVVKGNARVGVQVGGGKQVSRDERGNKVVRMTGSDGVTDVVTHVRRSPNHPDGPGITKVSWTER